VDDDETLRLDRGMPELAEHGRERLRRVYAPTAVRQPVARAAERVVRLLEADLAHVT